MNRDNLSKMLQDFFPIRGAKDLRPGAAEAGRSALGGGVLRSHGHRLCAAGDFVLRGFPW